MSENFFFEKPPLREGFQKKFILIVSSISDKNLHMLKQPWCKIYSEIQKMLKKLTFRAGSIYLDGASNLRNF